MDKWIVVQLGSRERYSVAQALHASGKLHSMITDLWIPPGNSLRKFYSRAASRYHEGLAAAPVISFNARMLVGNRIDTFTGSGFRKKYGMIADRLFSSLALQYLKRNATRLRNQGVTHIFCYNYYAAGIFEWAKNNGFKCVLGQIDAGPAAGKLVKKLAVKYQVNPGLFHDHYEGYLEKWKTEVGNASTIIVNSEWSKKLLTLEGAPEQRIRVVPLTFEAKSQPKQQHDKLVLNPLKVLFLGSLQIQKGVMEAFDAARQLSGRPVVFNFAGSLKMPQELLLRKPDNCHWLGFQDRAQVEKLFSDHHILLFPTHSDGFGLVQLEAMAQGVPVIASTHCGTVVKDGVNGLILNEVTPIEISRSINRLLDEPGLLSSLTMGTRVEDKFSFNSLVEAFKEID